MTPVSSIMHRFGFCILRYLDDWLALGASFQELFRARDFLLWLCQELGIRINLAKTSLTPTQSLDYLGMRLQTSPLRVFPTPKRVLKLSSLVQGFLSCHEHPLQDWHQLLGVMSSMSALVPGSRLRMRALQLRLSVAGPGLLDSTEVLTLASRIFSGGPSSPICWRVALSIFRSQSSLCSPTRPIQVWRRL